MRTLPRLHHNGDATGFGMWFAGVCIIAAIIMGAVA